jgi:hypothetical protein
LTEAPTGIQADSKLRSIAHQIQMEDTMTRKSYGIRLFWVAWLVLLPGFFPPVSRAASEIELWQGQTIYVPVYSHIYHGDRRGTLNLATTLSIRNTDPTHSITILKVNYHDSSGKLVRSYLENVLELGPLSSSHYLLKESDTSGGDTPCFIVKWTSSRKVNAPIIEGVMIGTASTQGISFVLTGQPISE